MRVYLNSGYSDRRMGFCEEDGDDAGPRAGFENFIARFDTAEVREQEAVEGETMAFFLLNNGRDSGAPEGNAVMG